MNRLQRRQAERQAARKPGAPARTLRQPHAQNRLLLLKNPQRLPETALLDSRIKLHLYLLQLKQEHDVDGVRYFQHFLDNIRTMCLLQERPKYKDAADKAQQELEASPQDGPRRFPWLSALVNSFDREMEHTSATLLVECNDHAAACGQLACIAVIIALPDYTAAALKQLLAGVTLKAAAEQAGAGQAELKKNCLIMLHQLHNLLWAEVDFARPWTLTAARRHKQIYLQAIDQLKSVAGQAAARVADFRRLFGVALVNLDAFIKTA